MKLLALAAGLTALLILMFLGGLLTATPALSILGFCTFAGLGNPLLWLSVYRFFTEVYALVPRKR